MKNLFVPYELAVIAKQKGFNEPCICYYDKNHIGELVGNLWNGNLIALGIPTPHESQLDIYAPLYQQIVDWFREKHGIIVYALSVTVITHKAKIEGIKGEWMGKDGSDYYEALTEAIEEAFKLI